MSLAGDTTVLCCPEGKECQTLPVITCNIRAQDAEEDHSLPLKTTVFDVELERCGADGCCPFGFSCGDGKDGKECKKNSDQSKRPDADGDEDGKADPTETKSTASSDPTSEPSSGPSSTTGANPTATNDPASETGDSSKEDSGPDTVSIVGGVVGACGVLLIVAVILFVCVRKRAKRRPAGTPPPSQPPTTQILHGRNISGPTNVDQNHDFGRCDFLQKRDTEPGEGLDDDGDGLGVLYPQDARQSRLRRLSSRFSRSDRGSSHFPFGGASPNPSIPETPVDQIPSNEFVRKGNVNSASVPPIRSMKPTSRTHSRHLHPEMARSISRRSRQLAPQPKRPARAEDDASSETILIVDDSQNDPNDGQAGQGSRRSCAAEPDHDRITHFPDFSMNKLMKETGMDGVGTSKTYCQFPGQSPKI